MKSVMTVEEWLGNNNLLGCDICKKKYQQSNETFNALVDRVSGGDEAIKQLILERKFIPAGRTLTNRGVESDSSLSNCYSSGYAPDDYAGLLDLNAKLGLTYKYQGGQGLSLSKLRPKGAPIAGGKYKSDGIIPFMEIFNQTTLSTSQGGSRKGALMMSLSCWHKEIKDFINIKSTEGKIEAANLSVEIDDEFMKSVKSYYDTGAEVKHEITMTFGPNNDAVTYEIIPIEVYRAMMCRAYDWGNPGCIFTEQFRNRNLMQYCDDYMVVTGNPCGEQPLATHAACNLGSINLAEFVLAPFSQDARFDFEAFICAVGIAISALDDIVEEGIERHPLPEQREQARNYRNIGLGYMGLADALIMLGLEYGSDDAISFVDELGAVMFQKALVTSNNIAKEKGAFPAYHKELWESDIIKSHFRQDEIDAMKPYGLRNCSLLSIAPTGSIGTMLDVSTGIEPFFRFKYQRTTKSLGGGQDVIYDVEAGIVKRHRAICGEGALPSYFISAGDIPWKNRIRMQAVAQKHIDTAISSTVNLPKDISIKEVERLYLFAWESKLKGITIFRDGSKRAGILTTSNQTEKNTASAKSGLMHGDIIEADDNVVGYKRKLTTGCGSLHCTAFFDPVTGQLLETYLSKGSSGGCNNFMIGLSRMISLSARAGIDIDSIVDQLSSCGACPSYAVRSAVQHDTSKGSCCPVAVGNALVSMYKELQSELSYDEETENKMSVSLSENSSLDSQNKDIVCPECGGVLIFEGGCNICKECGWSKCG